MDQARAEAHRRWGNKINRGMVWHTPHSKRRAVGYSDGEFRYCMGIGETWEEALQNADERLSRVARVDQ